MGIKEMVQKMLVKRGKSPAHKVNAYEGRENSGQSAALSDKMTVLTEKDLEGVQGGTIQHEGITRLQ